MVRIKTTTSKGIIFLSPFVYPEKAAISLIRSLQSWHKSPTYDMVDIPDDYPVECLYNQNWGIDTLVKNVHIAERVWQKRGK